MKTDKGQVIEGSNQPRSHDAGRGADLGWDADVDTTIRKIVNTQILASLIQLQYYSNFEY